MTTSAAATTLNPEKLHAALDDVTSFDASKRDAAASKLAAAAGKDAMALCVALLSIACDVEAEGRDPSASATRRLAAATYARNTLRKARAGDASIALPSPRALTSAALRALVKAPSDTRRLIADCLSTATTTSSSSSGDASSGDAAAAFAASSSSSDDAASLELVHEVAALIKAGAGDDTVNPGGLLATHAAAARFQYFRDLTAAKEATPAALETLAAEVLAPVIVPACAAAANALREGCEGGGGKTHERDAFAFTARVGFKTLFRATRAHAPAALFDDPATLRSICDSIETTCAGAPILKEEEDGDRDADPGYWTAAKRALRLAKTLAARHSAKISAENFSSLARAAIAVASAPPQVRQIFFTHRPVSTFDRSPFQLTGEHFFYWNGPQIASPSSVAAAFALLESILDVAGAPQRGGGGAAAAAAGELRARAWRALTRGVDGAAMDATDATRALVELIESCVKPHVCLTDADEASLREDPEEYARVNAVGEAAVGDAIEDALAAGGGGGGGAATARAAALDFVRSLVTTVAPCDDAAVAAAAAGGGGGGGGGKNKRKRDKAGKDGDDDDDDDEGGGKKPPTAGELALKAVVDDLLSRAPREKLEGKVSKAAAAAGAVTTYAPPGAEAAMGRATYVGLFALHGALASAAKTRRRQAPSASALRQFLARQSFPAIAAAASPHVVVAACAHVDAVSGSMRDERVAREAASALIAALERRVDADVDTDVDADVDDEDAWAVAREIASWTARSVFADAPCAPAAFGAVAASGAVASCAARLTTLIEARPSDWSPYDHVGAVHAVP